MTLSDVVLWLAYAMGGATVLALAALLVRRGLSRLLGRRMARRLRAVERVLQEHEKADLANVDRLLFELGSHDGRAVEGALSALLERAAPAVRPRVARLYTSLGLTARYIEQLESGRRWSDRAEAARALGLLETIEAIPSLVRTLRDPHEDAATVKQAVGQALARMRADEAIPALIEALTESEDLSSPRIAELLSNFGERAGKPLRDVLADAEQSSNARIWAAQVLGRIGDIEAVPLLLARLQDRAERMRMSAIEALGRIGDKRAINDLIGIALRDPVAAVRSEAARALGVIGDESVLAHLVGLLSDPDYWTRLRAIEAIELLKPSDSTPLEDALDDASVEVQRRAALALERIGVLAERARELASSNRAAVERARRTLVRLGRAGLLESLFAFVEQGDMRTRARVLAVLAEIGDMRSVPIVAPLVSDPQWPVRARAVDALARSGGEGTLELILPALSDSQESVRTAAVEAVQRLGVAPEHAQAVIAQFEAGNAEVRANVVDAVGTQLGDAVEDLVERALRDPNVNVRLRALSAVRGRERSDRLVNAVSERLTDESDAVRCAAAEALEGEASPSALRAIAASLGTVDRRFREVLTTVLAQHGLEVVRDLAGDSRSEQARLALAWSLGKTRDLQALDDLSVLSEHESAPVRAAAAGAIARLASAPRARELLRELSADPNGHVRAAAVNGLGLSGDEQDVDALLGRLSDPDAFVRNRLAIALGRIGGARGRDGLEYALRRAESDRERAYVVIGHAMLESGAGMRVALIGLSDEGVRHEVERALAHEPPDVERALRERLGLDEKQPTALDPQALKAQFSRVLRIDRRAERRLEAVDALRSLGFTEQIDLLVAVVRSDPDPGVRRAALELLARAAVPDPRVRDVFWSALADPADPVKAAAVAGLGGKLEARHTERLLRLLARAERGSELGQRALDALAQAHRDALGTFTDTLMGYRDTATLAAGARVLGRIGDPAATGLLSRWAENQGDEVLRLAAIWALGSLGTTSAKAALARVSEDPDATLRCAAVEAVSRLPGALEILAPRAVDPSVDVRLGLARLLGETESLAAIELADTLMRDPSDAVRGEAMCSLLALADASALSRFAEATSQLAEDQLALLRRRFAEHARADKQLHEQALTARQASTRLLALEALALLEALDADTLVAALRDPDAQVRIGAASHCGKVRSEAVSMALDALLDDPDVRVRDAARRQRMSVVTGGVSDDG